MIRSWKQTSEMFIYHYILKEYVAQSIQYSFSYVILKYFEIILIIYNDKNFQFCNLKMHISIFLPFIVLYDNRRDTKWKSSAFIPYL